MTTSQGILGSHPAAAELLTPRRYFTERVLILGTSAITAQLLREIDARPQLGYQVVGVIGEGTTSMALPNCPLWGEENEIGAVLDQVRPDRIIVALADRRGHLPVWQLLAQRVRGIPVEEASRALERITGKLPIESLAPSSLLFSGFQSSKVHDAVSRGVSLLCAATGLIFFLPLMTLIAVVIKLDSRGPVLFSQKRVGQGEKRFELLKFRTMDIEQEAKSEWARDNDERITRVGRWLRRLRLDELPQLLNIVRGDMNLVGPRPHPDSNFELFSEHIPYYWLRSVIRPGLTGWAQIRYGYANGLEEETEKMRYDLYYIKHRSLWLDLFLIAATAKTLVIGEERVLEKRATVPLMRPGR